MLGLLSGRKRTRINFSTTASTTAAFGLFLGKLALSDTSGAVTAVATVPNSLGTWNVVVAASAGSLLYTLLQHVLPNKIGGKFFESTPNNCAAVKGAIVGVASIASGAGLIQPEYAVLSTVCATTIVYIIDLLTKDVTIAGFDAFVSSAVTDLPPRRPISRTRH